MWQKRQRPSARPAPKRQQASRRNCRTQPHHLRRHRPSRRPKLHPDRPQRHWYPCRPPRQHRSHRYRQQCHRRPPRPRRPSQPEPRPRQCPRRPRPKVAPAWCQKPWQKPGTPPDRAWLRHGQSLHDDATRRAGTRPQTYPFVSYCLHLEHCPAAAPRHRAHCARVPPSGSPLPSRAQRVPAACAAAACKMGGDPT